MATKGNFYDATKPENRDETWRRWAGGDQLATDLRDFYTAKKRTTMLAQSAPIAADPVASNGQKMRTALVGAFLRGGRVDWQTFGRARQPVPIGKSPATFLPGMSVFRR